MLPFGQAALGRLQGTEVAHALGSPRFVRGEPEMGDEEIKGENGCHKHSNLGVGKRGSQV